MFAVPTCLGTYPQPRRCVAVTTSFSRQTEYLITLMHWLAESNALTRQRSQQPFFILQPNFYLNFSHI